MAYKINDQSSKKETQDDGSSLNDNSSVWSKESVINQTKALSVELEKEKKNEK